MSEPNKTVTNASRVEALIALGSKVIKVVLQGKNAAALVAGGACFAAGLYVGLMECEQRKPPSLVVIESLNLPLELKNITQGTLRVDGEDKSVEKILKPTNEKP